MSSPSNLNTAHSRASHSRFAHAAIVSKTGCAFVGELLMTPRISAVAVCCSRASLRERCTSAYDGAGWTSPWWRWRGVPHSPQNFIVGRFSCWHRGHVMPEPPSGRGVGRSEPWVETNRPRLVWSRTRSDGSPVQLAGCRRSWLRNRASAVDGGQSVDALTAGPEQGPGFLSCVQILPALLHCRPP